MKIPTIKYNKHIEAVHFLWAAACKQRSQIAGSCQVLVPTLSMNRQTSPPLCCPCRWNVVFNLWDPDCATQASLYQQPGRCCVRWHHVETEI